ncbi:DUF885 domain-containing protein [Parashewanella curva]|uniref:DUF885 domain-containing protein n=1 Tax=Parashewanella curva TaxID=2338552 RepID=A0A3L8Q273_9GAMM|nr:DUF885 domain-containing protein [Parashewanella curva]RLV60412.1 DUF885 domain-containing protein [Parashewanella curva]
MKKSLLFMAISSVLTLSACQDNDVQETQVTSKKQASSAVSSKQQSAEKIYLDLVDNYFKDQLKLNPLMATFVGNNDYNDEFGSNLTEAYLKARHELNQGYLDKLKKIDRASLPTNLQFSYDLFGYDRNMELISETYPSRWLPMNQFYNTVITMVQLGTGESAQPFKTVEDYQNWLSRLDGFIEWTQQAQERMNQGIESKVVLPRVLAEKIVPQLQAHIVANPEESIFFAPIKNIPDNFTDSQKAELTASYKKMIAEKLVPALASLKDYFKDTYIPKTRAADGWWGLPNGKAWYQHLANQHTTTKMPVDEIHEIGLSEVARILSEMDKVREQVGFKGDLKAFFAHLSSDPKYFFTERQDLVDGYMGLKDSINKELPKYFNVMPEADYIVKPVEAFREQSAAGASYQSPAVDGSRPGIFYINTYNLKAQPKWGMTTLSLHEAAPGHHFQIAIKQELKGVPQFQRFSGYTAFEEGWALYAEYLGMEMGLFKDPYQYFGKLSDEMLRAMRLVVDTGLHAKGWSREQAIQYMKDNSPMAESDITAEVERYMAIPGQALSYKIGQLKIIELRERAEKALGNKFDIKAFHDQILTTGSLPMAVMEDKIDSWIASNQ